MRITILEVELGTKEPLQVCIVVRISGVDGEVMAVELEEGNNVDCGESESGEKRRQIIPGALSVKLQNIIVAVGLVKLSMG